MKDREKLKTWQDRLARAESAYQGELENMEERESIYRGQREIRPLGRGHRVQRTAHVRNIAAELVEAQVDASIPQPKVTARRREDEALAKVIEDMLRGELDRLPMEALCDMQERIVTVQGGALYLVEWDSTARTHETVGELALGVLHPRQVIPQDGVTTSIEDMDYIILKLPQTKETIRRRYGAEVSDESESEPGLRGGGAKSAGDELVTQYAAYYRNDRGGIGLFSWVNDRILADYEDYQARRLRRCAKCGAAEPGGDAAPPDRQTGDGEAAERESGVCPYCGAREKEESEEAYEVLTRPVLRSDGSVIQASPASPVRVPCYRPGIYPVILQRNISVYGSFLGESDVEKIRDQQNTANRIEEKIIEKLVSSGSYLSLPAQADIEADDRDMKIIRPGSAADMSMIGVYTMEGDIDRDLTYLEQVYQEARQIIGVTESFQGRRDTTATSGRAKEFAAAQSAGRLESKRRMKDAAYAALFEAMFRFRLAYADEPRPVLSRDVHGRRVYRAFNRYDFLQLDEAGEWFWNDRFLFSCDTSAALASNREAMWQETRLNLQTGAFGDPAKTETLILFWSKMEQLHYPGAGETRRYLEEQAGRAAAQAPPRGAQAPNAPRDTGRDRDAAQRILLKARPGAGVRLS